MKTPAVFRRRILRTSFEVFVAFAMLVVKGLGDDFLFI